MPVDGYLSPYEGRLKSTRNATELSRFCDELVATFLSHGASMASVRVDLAPYGADALYKGLWNACSKKDYTRRVSVHKQDGELLLIRKKEKRMEGRER